MAISVRSARLPQDAAAIGAIDRSFVSRQALIADAGADGIFLRLRDLDAPVRKIFPLDDLDAADRPWSEAWVALAGQEIVGFAATAFEAWNRRLTLWHLYVDASARRRGAAQALIEAVIAHGEALGARHIWLETSSLNVEGVAAYQALGFSLTGVDLTLYDGTPAEGEAALFFSRPLRATTASPTPSA